MRSVWMGLLLCIVPAFAGARAAVAQTALAAKPEEPPACIGFRFGAWTPPLDWQRAGHRVAIDTARVARTAEGRAWAAATPSAAGDTALILFPTWWPAGVMVELNARALASGDTVMGRATAFVADGNREPSRSAIRAWRVPCGR